MKTKRVIERIFTAPAQSLEEGVEIIEEIEVAVQESIAFGKVTEYKNAIGPGLITGAADDDPSGIATYSQAGAQYGFQLLWLSFFTFPLMAVVQEMSARLGMVTGRGLAANIRIHYPAWVLYTCTALLFVANTLNLGADLGAMAKATQLLAPALRFDFLVAIFAIGILLVQIFMDYGHYVRYLKYLTVALFAYVATAFFITVDWNQVIFSTLIPSITFSKTQILLICAVLGTTISPYLFFWQTSQEVEEAILQGKRTLRERQHAVPKEALTRMRVDVWLGMFVSNAVMFFIIVVAAATLHAHGITNITTADQAALVLRPLVGEWAYLLFALGIIGTGLLAIPVLAGSAAYAISESFRWKQGLYRKLGEAYAFYGVIIAAMLVGFAINFIGLDPIKALIYSAILNGLIAPVILVLLVQMASKKEVMKTHVNGRLSTIIAWITIGLMIISGIAVFATFL